MHRNTVIDSSITAVLQKSSSKRGGLCSYFDPVTEEKWCFMGGESCLLSTAGMLSTLIILGKSGDNPFYWVAGNRLEEHIAGLRIKRGRMKGAFYTGVGSGKVMPNYTAHALDALMDSGAPGDAILEGLEWLVSVQLDSGGFIDIYEKRGVGWKHNNRRPLWQSQIIRVLYRGALMFDNEAMAEAARRCYRWAMEMFEKGEEPVHPAGVVGLLEAAMLLRDKHGMQLLGDWCSSAVTPAGLFHEYYMSDGHSPELDVMPTAHLGIVLLGMDRPSDRYGELLDRIEKGILSAYVENIGFRGLPGHEELGRYIYTWDTAWAVRFLALKREHHQPSE